MGVLRGRVVSGGSSADGEAPFGESTLLVLMVLREGLGSLVWEVASSVLERSAPFEGSPWGRGNSVSVSGVVTPGPCLIS